jgi:hypothetical protein
MPSEDDTGVEPPILLGVTGWSELGSPVEEVTAAYLLEIESYLGRSKLTKTPK